MDLKPGEMTRMRKAEVMDRVEVPTGGCLPSLPPVSSLRGVDAMRHPDPTNNSRARHQRHPHPCSSLQPFHLVLPQDVRRTLNTYSPPRL